MIGCTRDEAILFSASAWDDWTWEQAQAGLEEALPPQIVKTVVHSQAWKGSKRPVEAFNAVVSEASFCGGIVQGGEMLAERNKGRIRVHFYIMECPDEHPGPLQGWAAHAADVSTVFYQPAQQDYPNQAAVADQHAAYLLGFVHGEDLKEWEEIGENGMYMAFTAKNSCLKHLHRDRKDRELVFEDLKDQETFYGSGFAIIGASLRIANRPDHK